MDVFDWSSKFETGLASVDRQHQRLVTLINSLGDGLARRGQFPGAELDSLYAALAEYVVEHFTDEERLMTSGGVDARSVNDHVGQHRRFQSDLAVLREIALRAGVADEEPARLMMKFLVSWLAFHILGTDQQMARQLGLIRGGLDAGEAFARVVRPEDSSARLILDSIDELLGIVAQRNRSLAEANATLERRVEERTHELNARVAELNEALAHVKQLQGVIPICMHCHRIRNDADGWEKLEHYVQGHSEAKFSHGICPECVDAHHP